MGLSIVGYFDGVEAGTFKVGVNTFDIRVKMQEKEGLDQLQEIPALPLKGRPVAMNALAKMKNSPVAISLMRQDKERSAWIYANSAPGHSMADLMGILQKELVPKLPQGYRLVFTGQAEMMNEGAMDFVLVLITAVFLTFLVIAAIMHHGVAGPSLPRHVHHPARFHRLFRDAPSYGHTAFHGRDARGDHDDRDRGQQRDPDHG